MKCTGGAEYRRTRQRRPLAGPGGFAAKVNECPDKHDQGQQGQCHSHQRYGPTGSPASIDTLNRNSGIRERPEAAKSEEGPVSTQTGRVYGVTFTYLW